MNLCFSWAFSQPSAVNTFYRYTVQFLINMGQLLHQNDFVANWLWLVNILTDYSLFSLAFYVHNRLIL